MRNNEERLGGKIQKDDSLPPITQNVDRGLNLNFVVPTEFVELPSRGRFYSSDHPLRNKTTIEIKQMTAKEEDLLTSKSLLKKGIALDKVIESLVVDKSIEVDSLTAEDRSAIVVAARISGYGPEYVTSITCPSCETKVKYSFDLNTKLPKDDDEPEFDPPVDDNGYFEIELPITKWIVKCRALDGRDEKTLLRINEIKKKSLNDSILMSQLKLMIVSVQDLFDDETISLALEKMPAGDSRYLRKMYQAIVRSVDMRQNFVCEKCEYETDLEVPLNADFFWIK